MPYTSLREAQEKMARYEPFRGNSLWAKIEDDEYLVYSYRTLIFCCKLPDGQEVPQIVYYDDSRYSATTSKHQSYIRRAFDLSRGDIGPL